MPKPHTDRNGRAKRRDFREARALTRVTQAKLPIGIDTRCPHGTIRRKYEGMKITAADRYNITDRPNENWTCVLRGFICSKNTIATATPCPQGSIIFHSEGASKSRSNRNNTI